MERKKLTSYWGTQMSRIRTPVQCTPRTLEDKHTCTYFHASSWIKICTNLLLDVFATLILRGIHLFLIIFMNITGENQLRTK